MSLPNLRIRAAPQLPVKVQSGAGIAAALAGNTLTIGSDFSSVQETSPAVLSGYSVLLQKAADGSFERVSASILSSGGSLSLPFATTSESIAGLSQTTVISPFSAAAAINAKIAPITPPFSVPVAGVAAVGSADFVIKSQLDAVASLAAFVNQSGRLSSSPGLAVPVADAAIVTSVSLVPFAGDRMPIFDGSSFVSRAFSDLSLALSASAHLAGSVYDVFAFVKNGAVAIGTGPAWASASGRGVGAGTTEIQSIRGALTNKVAISLFDGAANAVPAGQATLIGSFRATANGQSADTRQTRYISNAVNRVERDVLFTMPTGTWTHSLDSFAISGGGGASNFVGTLQSVQTGVATLELVETYSSSTGATFPFVGIGVNSTTVDSSIQRGSGTVTGGANVVTEARALYSAPPLLGVNLYYPLERASSPGATVTWYGGGPGIRFQSALVGTIPA